MMSKKPRKRYTEEFKAQAVEVLRIGKPLSELAEELCVSADLLYRWIAWLAGLRWIPNSGHWEANLSYGERGSQVGSEGRRAVGERSEGRTPSCAWRMTF
jgi:transposase-like protein